MLGLELYPDVMSPQTCNQIISMFEDDQRKSPGKSMDNIVNEQVKASTDLQCDFTSDEYTDYNNLILPTVVNAVDKFRSTYQFLDYIDEWEITGIYNIQRYLPGQGFFIPHCEHSAFFYRRILAWMIYLNTTPEGTEFPYQKIKLQASQGNAAVWSAHWTHPHKGVTPTTQTKYIVTGWCQYKIHNV